MRINTIIKTSLLVLLVSNLSARENPFVPTTTFIEIKESLVDKGNIVEPYNPNDKGRTIGLMEQNIEKEIVPEPIVEPIVIKEVKIEPVEIKPIVLQEETKEIEEIIITETKIKDPITKDIVPVEVKSYKYNLLDFVKIDILSDIMSIDTKSKLITHFILKDENKIVFDFEGAQNFYTKRESLSSHDDFKKLIVGAHPKYKYFRVVIQTSKNVKDYKVTVEKSGLITINKIVNN